MCGFQFLSAGSDYDPPEDLDAFLKAGERPIYIGFGSIVVENPKELTKTIFEAVRRTGQRALISKGWSNIGAVDVEVPDNIFLLGNAPMIGYSSRFYALFTMVVLEQLLLGSF